MIADSIIKLAIPVASLLATKEANKYKDRLLEIQKELQDEEFKPIPDDGRISYLQLELVRISDVLANALIAKTA